VDGDIAGAAHQVMDHRAVEDLEPSRALGLADDDMRGVVALCKGDDVVGEPPCLGRQLDRFALEALGEAQRVGDPVARILGKVQASAGLQVESGPGRVQTIGEPLGIAHEGGRTRVLADTDENALTRGPRSRDGARLHVLEQLLVDPLRRAAQRQFAQRGEIGGGEEVPERALGLLGDVDPALLQPLDQIVRRQIDEFDGIGIIDHLVRHGLAHPHAGDLRDHVVQALDMLDIDGRIHVDAGIQQLFDVEVALGMTAARDVGVGKLIDEDEARAPFERGVEIELVEDAIDVDGRLAG